MSILMRTSKAGLALIETRCVCHLDSAIDECPKHEAGYTIGFAHVGHDVKAGQHITQARADEILRDEDLPEFEGVVNRYAPMSQSEFDQLVAVAFWLSRK